MRRALFLRRPSGLVLASLLMALLLGVLAVLQFRWVGQLSANERERMRSHLTARADSLSTDFNRELTRAFFWLQLGPELVRHATPQTDVERYAHWYAAAPRPELVQSIYRVTIADEPGTPLILEQFQRDPGRLERVAWPAALAPIRTRIEDGIARRVEDPKNAPPVRIALSWPDLPAIAIPRVEIIEPNSTRIAAALGWPGAGYTIALFDSAYIRNDLLPQLVERHFAIGQEDSLFVGIYADGGLQYAAPSVALPRALADSPDVRSGDLFDLRLWERNRFVVERTMPAGAGAGAGATPGSGAPPQAARTVINVLRDDRGRSFRGGGGPPSPAVPHWSVHVLHRAGSLDLAVSQARMRNLLVSFGVLLMLGASMGLVLVATGRARRLASQQMEFVAGVSHELRTPLAVIRSAAENLADGIVSDPKQVRRYGEVITGEGRRLTQMVEQIMEFAGFESGRTTLEVRPADVGAILDEALRTAAHLVREHGATIEQRVASALPPVLVDASAVSRSVQNLLVNALKYGGAPPLVRIEATLAPGRPGDVQISVADNGAGIAARDLPHIFEPFYRGADATSRQIHGSGLGLSLVKRIVQEVGGRVSVRTEPGKGSTFTLHLPVAPEGVRESAGPLPDPHAPLSAR